MIHLLAVDAGRSRVKIIGDGTREAWPAAIGPARKLNLERDLAYQDMTVEYGGEAFFVGNIAQEESISGTQMMLQSKAHPDTRILVLAAIHRNVPDGADVFLVTGSPIENRDEAEKKKFKQMLAGPREITVNGITKRFTVIRVGVSPECAAAAWAMRRPGTYTVVDPGSRTVNYATIRNGKYWDQMSGTLDYGMETTQGMSPSHFARMVAADLTRRMRTLPPVTLIGGAAAVLLEPLGEWLQSVEAHPDPLYANAAAFYEMGGAVLAQAKRA